MRIGGLGPLPDSTDLGQALAVVSARSGHRPALTVLGPGRREEQGFASLAQWAAKGAHLLELDLGLGPGGRLAVEGPPGWLPAAVCLAAWWAGVAVVDRDPDAAVRHEIATPDATRVETLWFGDEVDGSPSDPSRRPAFAVEVQAFPDQPPPRSSAPELLALEVEGTTLSQAELLDHARRRWPTDGPLGLSVADAPDRLTWIAATAVRPLVTGRPTVVLVDGERSRAEPEGVAHWEPATPGGGVGPGP